MKTKNIKNKINCEKIDMKKLSIKELKPLKNQAKSLIAKRMKRKCKSSNRKRRDYCVALKGNQGNFYNDVQDYFDEDKLLVIESGYEGSYSLTREKSHNQIITYEYYQTEKVKWYFEKKVGKFTKYRNGKKDNRKKILYIKFIKRYRNIFRSN